MRKNGFLVMCNLLQLVKPLAHIMVFTITMGTLGFLSAIFIMVLGAMGLSHLLGFEGHLSCLHFCAIKSFLRCVDWLLLSCRINKLGNSFPW